jgi:RimJ/RimL family protein N-acetyltransferase
MTTIYHVLTEHVPLVLPKALPFIEQGMEHATAYNTEHVKVYLADGKWNLFVAADDSNEVVGAYVVSFQNEPNDRVAFIISAAGRGLGSELLPQLDALLQQFGATKAKALARESAARLYKRWGFEEKSVLLEKKYG